MGGSTGARSRALHLPLGRAAYRPTLDVQRKLHALRCAGEIPDLLITVEHDPVITVGRTGSYADLLVGTDALQDEGIELCEVERGGGITYHGPGQVVVYPIVDLRAHGRDIRRFVRGVETAVVEMMDSYGISALPRAGYPGVWVDERKVASIGVYVKGWVTRHGVAVNVAVDPSHFAMIRPCGLPVEAISMTDLTGDIVEIREVRDRLLERFAAAFGWRVETTNREAVLADG